MITIEDIKNECRAIIAQAEKATPGPWMQNQGDTCNTDVIWRRPEMEGEREGFMVGRGYDADASFIASSRSFTPKAARALMATIEALEVKARRINPYQCSEQGWAVCDIHQREARADIESIRASWEVSK